MDGDSVINTRASMPAFNMDANVVFKTSCQRALKAIGTEAATPILEQLISYIKTGGDTGGSYDLLFPRLFGLVLSKEEANLPFQNVLLVEELLSELLTSPATLQHMEDVKKHITVEFVDLCLAAFQQHSGRPQQPDRKLLWKNLIHKLYRHCWAHREHMMGHMKGFLSYVARAMVSEQMLDSFLKQMLAKNKGVVSEENGEFTAMFYTLNDLLEILGAIVAGFRRPVADSHVRELLFNALMPLHTNPLCLDEFRAMLSVYAKPLAYCISTFVAHEPKLAISLVPPLCSIATDAKTPAKSVPFIVSELEAILHDMPRELFKHGEIRRALKKLVIESVASLQFTVSQRTLLFLKLDKVLEVFHTELKDITYQSLVPVLLKTGGSHWNDTTRQLALTVLKKLGEFEDSPVLGMRDYQQLMNKHNQMVSREESSLALKHKRMGERKANLRHFDFVYVKRGLGEGSYSVVHHVRRIDRKTEQRFWEDYAMKAMEKEQLEQENYLEEAQREIRLLQGPLADHPLIVKLITTFEDERRLYMILEYAEHGDVFHALDRLGTVTEDYARFIAAETALALEHVHAKGFMHLDLKPENLLVHRTGHIRLTDFGTSQEVAHEGEFSLQGTAEYLSPALVSGSRPSPQDDWWAFAMLLYQLLAGHTPFNGMDKQRLFADIQGAEIKFDDAFPPAAKDLILSITNALRGPRPQEVVAATVKQHPFFAGVAWKGLAGSEAPQPAGGAKKAEQIDPNLRQRKYSMMLTNTLPKRYHFSTLSLDPIAEYPEQDDGDAEMEDAC